MNDPIKAESAIITVLQMVIRSTAFFTLEPPRAALTPPNNARKLTENKYSIQNNCSRGKRKMSKKGRPPPTKKLRALAPAASNGFAEVISFIPNSSRA